MQKRPFGRAQRVATEEPVPAPVMRRAYSDMRRSRRTKTVLAGTLFSGQDGLTLDCVIADLSETGARVRIEPESVLPAEVFLVHLRDYVAYEATIAWRRENGMLGLRFKSEHDLRKEPEDKRKMAMRAYCAEHSLRSVPPPN
jgi:hypothetical protein